MQYQTITPAEKWITHPVKTFINKTTTGAIVLFLSALLAVIIANSPWSEWYFHLWEHKFGFAFNDQL